MCKEKGNEQHRLGDILNDNPIDESLINNLLKIVDEEFYTKQVILYDFKRPNVFSKQQLSVMKQIHNNIFDKIQKELATRLNTNIEIQLHCVDQLTFDEYFQYTEDKCAISALSMVDTLGLMYVGIDKSILEKIGQSFNASLNNSHINFIEKDVIMDNFLETLYIKALKDGFKNICSLNPYIFDFDIKNDKVMNKNEVIMYIALEIIIDNSSSGYFNIAYPYRYNHLLFNTLKTITVGDLL